MKKGFTLIELLAVIIVLGILAMVVIPAIADSLESSEEKLQAEQIKQIEGIARTWGASNTGLLPDTGTYYLTLDTLKSEGLLENKDILDPKTKMQLTGCVAITFNTSVNQYTYAYGNTCE